MKVLTLARSYLDEKTIGWLFCDGFCLRTLERPQRDNQQNISCIPEGAYHVKRDKAGRFKYYEVTGVDGRSNIEFHAGNNVEHSRGCILVGESHNEYYNLVNSNNAISELLEYIGDNDFILHIRAATRDDF